MFANANFVFYICNVILKQSNDIYLIYYREYNKNTPNMEQMEQFIKGETLPKMLRAMKVGQTVDVQPSAYKVNYVQQACRRLKEKGFVFKVTEKGLITGCHVTRLR